MICAGPLIRLVGGNSYYEGRVEVNYDSEWGTVCDDGWDNTDAGVVCRQLGFGLYGSAYFGEGSGPILLDNITCTGSESTLANCGHLGVGVIRSCSHSEDVGVRCSSSGTYVLHRLYNCISAIQFKRPVHAHHRHYTTFLAMNNK